MKAQRRTFLQALIGAPVVASMSAPSTPVVNLKITHQEAQALANVLAHVGGNQRLSDRGHIDTINELLHEHGFGYQCGNVRIYGERDGIRLRNYSEYEHTRPSGPSKPFQHQPSLRYLRRQQDGVSL